MDLASIERRFSNLASLWQKSAISVITYSDPKRDTAFNKLVALQKQARLHPDKFENLSRVLSYIHWDLRGYLGVGEHRSMHWSMRLAGLTQELASSKPFMEPAMLSASTDLMESISSLIESDDSYSNALISSIKRVRTLLVVEKDRQRELVSNLLAEAISDFDGAVVQMQTLFQMDVQGFDEIIILAAPRRISDNYMRALLMGGVTPAATFLCSNWLAGNEPQKVEQELTPGLPGSRKLVLSVTGPALDQNFQDVTKTDFEELQAMPIDGSFSSFSGGGVLECRLIRLSDGHVMPVERSSKRVSVLKRSQEGGFVVEYRTPGKDLEAGDIIFELRDGAEEDFLMDQAEIAMGTEFEDFARGRAEWKRRLADLVSSEGKAGAVRKLKEAGVKTAAYIDDWLGNVDFTTPRAKKDWHNLLVSLGFAPAEISRLEELGTKLRASLIAVGLKARSYMAEAVDFADLERIRNREIVMKQLDGFGDAVFVLAMVESAEISEATCEPQEMRKVLKV